MSQCKNKLIFYQNIFLYDAVTSPVLIFLAICSSVLSIIVWLATKLFCQENIRNSTTEETDIDNETHEEAENNCTMILCTGVFAGVYFYTSLVYAYFFYLISLIKINYRAITDVMFELFRLRSEVDSEKVMAFSEKRQRYWNRQNISLLKEAEIHKSKALPCDKFFILSCLNHENLMVFLQPQDEIYYDLKQFMSCLTWENLPAHLPPHIDIVTYARDILRGAQYLHDRHIFHLNIIPENILIAPNPNCGSGTAKITGFTYVHRSAQHTVNYSKIGLKTIYRPPEYYLQGILNAAAIDYWGIGITLYEILTGGMITIYTEGFTDVNIYNLMKGKGMSELSFFASAVDASWHYEEFLKGSNSMIEYGDTVYHLCRRDFLKDAWKFVNGLMQPDPSQRSTLSEALKSSFITETITSWKPCYLVRNPRSESYYELCPVCRDCKRKLIEDGM